MLLPLEKAISLLSSTSGSASVQISVNLEIESSSIAVYCAKTPLLSSCGHFKGVNADTHDLRKGTRYLPKRKSKSKNGSRDPRLESHITG